MRPVAHTCNLATQEAEIRKIATQSQPQANISLDPISKKPITFRKGLVKWFKIQALSSNSSTTKKKKKKKKKKEKKKKKKMPRDKEKRQEVTLSTQYVRPVVGRAHPL
jgi:hypothetical protein